MNTFSSVCGLVFLISLLTVKVESSGWGEIEKKVNATLEKVNEVEGGSNLELIRIVYTMSTRFYVQVDIEITENKVKTSRVLTINEQFLMDHAKVELRCIPAGGGKDVSVFSSLFQLKACRLNLFFSVDILHLMLTFYVQFISS